MSKENTEKMLRRVNILFYLTLAFTSGIIISRYNYGNDMGAQKAPIYYDNTHEYNSGLSIYDNTIYKDINEAARANLDAQSYNKWHYEVDILTEVEDEFFELEKFGDTYYLTKREDADDYCLDGHYVFDLDEEVEEVDKLYKYAISHPEYKTAKYNNYSSTSRRIRVRGIQSE